MRLVETRLDGGSEAVRLTGRIATRSGPVELWFEYPAALAALVRNDADVFVPAMLPVAMLRGEPVEVSLPSWCGRWMSGIPSSISSCAKSWPWLRRRAAVTT